MDSGGIDPKFWDFVSQVAHFCATYAIALTLMLFAKIRKNHRWLIVFGLIVAYACFHEFYYDPRFENAATRGSDLEDWFFLVAGAAAAELMAWWRIRDVTTFKAGLK